MENTVIKNNNISKGLIRHMIAELLQEVLADPDLGLELTSDATVDIKESIKQKKEGKVVSLEEVLKKRNKKE